MDRLDRKRALKLRFRRHLRMQRRQVEELGANAERRLEDDFFKRLERLGVVRRFVTSWILLLVLLLGVVVAQTRSLSGYYQVLAPTAGGTYVEGMLGSFTNANPIYATDLVDTSVSRLLFASLLTYNEQNQLVGDLADRWTVDDSGKVYTVHLRPELTWHDGQRLTAHDVAYTFRVIQNPDARSPLYGSWAGITIKATDNRTVVFTLPSPLAAFPHSLTTGIVPQHILGGTAMADMRSVPFNSTEPIGAGPFQWQAIELAGGSADRREEKIALKAFDHYYAGKPKLNSYVVRTFRDADRMVNSFKEQEITGMAGLTQVPSTLKDDGGMRVYNLPLTASVMTFFRTQNGILADVKIRQALVRSINQMSIIDSLGYPTRPVREPLLPGQLAYNPAYHQAAYDPTGAAKLLDESGWVLGENGIRAQNGKPLSFSLYYLNSPEYSSVAQQLAKQWRAIGVEARLMPQNEADFGSSILSNAPSQNGGVYDALLYGTSIGVDPDVFVYWHGSQIDLRSPVRLNFSQYQSSAADAGLESGRTRLDPALRTAKYQPFLQAWQTDAPALGLYQPRFLYITHGQIHGLQEMPVNSDVGRLRNVHNWQIRERWETPLY